MSLVSVANQFCIQSVPTLSKWERIYYEEIGKNPLACLIKCLDRCNNITTMTWALSRERIYRTIKETEEYFPTLISVLKEEVEYSDAAWLIKYQMESLLDVYKRLM